MTEALAIRQEPEIIPGASETALLMPDDLTESEWLSLGEKLGRIQRASAWWIGDWLLQAEKKWGEKYEEAMEITGLSYSHLKACAHVARRFHLDDRSSKLTWTHYFRAKALNDAERWLAQAAEESWSVRELEQRTVTSSRTRVFPTRRHDAVINAADAVTKAADRWERSMTDALTPPQARKQLTILNKAATRLSEVIEAVEYRADTLATFHGR